jgi:RNA polymerase sigma-70 factor (ECF subfamily)
MIAMRSAVSAATEGGSSLDPIEETLRPHLAYLLRLAQAILHDPAEAEDAVQDVLLLAWRSWDQMRDPSSLRAWLTTICVRRCLRMRISLVHRRQQVSDKMVHQVPVLDSESWVTWDWAFAGLSPRQRAVVSLHYRHGYTLDECAHIMGCRPGSARQHLFRALARLRKETSDAR